MRDLPKKSGNNFLLGSLLACYGFGVWALVFMNLSTILFNSVFYLFIHNWRPVMMFNIQAFKTLFRFGGKVFILGLMDSVFNNIY